MGKQTNTYIPPTVKDDMTEKAGKCQTEKTLLDLVSVKDKNVRFLLGQDAIEIKAWIQWKKHNGFPIVFDEYQENTECVTFIFKRVTHEFWKFIEEKILDEVQEEHEKMLTYNFSKLNMFVLKWLLKSWSLPIELERYEDGQLTDECFVKVTSVHPRILSHFVHKLTELLFISETEKSKISRQSVLLFSPKSKGVQDACEAISLYCTLSGFWEKFGLNYFDLARMPHDVFVRLKTVLTMEMEIKASKTSSNPNAGKNLFKNASKHSGKTQRTPLARF